MWWIVIYLLTVLKYTNKDSGINRSLLCLSNVSKDFPINSMKKTRLDRYIYDFSVDYDSIDADYIFNIHKYVRKKHKTNVY